MKEFHMFKSFYLRQQAKTSESLIAKEAEFFLQALSWRSAELNQRWVDVALSWTHLDDKKRRWVDVGAQL